MQRDLLAVNEIFETVQGEATFTGTPSVFIRLQGCPVGCAWCDTKHTWPVQDDNRISTSVMLIKDKEAPTFAAMGVDELVGTIAAFKSRHIVITGGEPCMYDLTALNDAIVASGRKMQVETSGTFEIKVRQFPHAWVTLSPKINKPGRLRVLRSSYERADEIKLPVAIERDITDFDNDIGARFTIPTSTQIWLQPVYQSKHGMEICQRVAAERGWRVSLQGHKAYGIR